MTNEQREGRGVHGHRHAAATVSVNPLYARPGEEAVPRFEMAQRGLSPETAYQVVHDEIALDGAANLNLATFVTTEMDPWARRIYGEAASKNMIDKDEYPQTAAIEDRCIHILASLWHAPDPHQVVGVSTTGSSEACMLAGLALKRRWQQRREAAGQPTDRPNMVFSSAVQVVWEKFARYWDVEPRYVNVTEAAPRLTPEGVRDVVDDHTIGVVVVLGVTYTGVYEPVAEIAAALDQLARETDGRLDIPIHVDGASGAFVAPFLQPDLAWDFRLARVHSINASGHKYGLVVPGLGWALWRDADCLPEDLVFRVSYLGGSMPTFGLNFSRPGAQVLLQYYNFLHLGFDGYRRVQQASQDVARYVSGQVAKLGPFDLLSDGRDIPVFAWRMKPGRDHAHWDLYTLSHVLRERGWQVPAYPLPPSLEQVTIMRVVVRHSFSMDLAHLLVDDLERAVKQLEQLDRPFPADVVRDSAFAH